MLIEILSRNYCVLQFLQLLTYEKTLTSFLKINIFILIAFILKANGIFVISSPSNTGERIQEGQQEIHLQLGTS